MRNVHKDWYSRGYLPHFDVCGLIQHITFHLADSLPDEAIKRMHSALDALPEISRPVEKRKRIQGLLDAGMGSCLLAQPDCARIVEDTLLFGDAERYRLLCWSIMPNHTHVLIEQQPGWPLGKVVQSWKRHTSRQIHRLGFALGSPSCTRHAMYNLALPDLETPEKASALWQRDYWDRFIRNEQHLLTARHYIEQNPVQAGLVENASQWHWGSARL